MRAAIGAALQEAALDPLLTGRDHMRLQAALQGLPKASARARGDELLERVGLAEAADRKVGGYSGGMKRRLDLALALVHRPRVLFLDEPTTGLDPSSRAALWAEVARLAREDGVTVFLTTQYLEEADVLADRVGIIDHGRIVAEGTPESLKAEIGRPSVEAMPVERADRDAVAAVLEPFGVVVARARRARRPCACRAARTSSRSSARSTPRACAIADLQLHQPDARRRLPGQDRPQARGASDDAGGEPPRRAARDAAAARSSRSRAARSCGRCASPRMVIPPILFPLILLAINVGGPRRGDQHPGLPRRHLPRLRDRVPVHAGRAVRDDQRRHATSRATSRPASSTGWR